MLGRNTIAKVSYNEGATPNARGNYGVKSVTRTGAGVFDVELVYGYSPDSDFASVEVTGSSPGFAQAEPVPGDASRIRVLTWDTAAPPVPADRPFSLRIERDTPLAGAQDLLQQQEPPRAVLCN